MKHQTTVSDAKIRYLRDKVVKTYESQPGVFYTSGPQYDHRQVIAPSGDTCPAQTMTITHWSVAPSGAVDASGNFHASGYPFTDQYGALAADVAKEPPLLQAGGSLSIHGFRRLMGDVLEILQPHLIFVPAYPDWVKPDDQRITKTSPTGETVNKSLGAQEGTNFFDTITFKVLDAYAGTFDPHPINSPGGRRRIKPYEREIQVDPTSANELQQVYVQELDNYVQFDLFTRTNYEAEELLEWFEYFMDTFTYAFMYAGIQKMHFHRRLEDSELKKWRTGLSIRSIQYYVRTQKIYVKNVNRIDQINIRLLDVVTTPGELAALRRARMQRDPWTAVRAAFCSNSS
jgi:hypothetical protein